MSRVGGLANGSRERAPIGVIRRFRCINMADYASAFARRATADGVANPPYALAACPPFFNLPHPEMVMVGTAQERLCPPYGYCKLLLDIALFADRHGRREDALV
jgi:hypothetical protein